MRGLIALLLILGLATTWAIDTTASPADTGKYAVSQTIRSDIEAMPDTHARALLIGGLSLPQAIAKFYAARAYAPAWDSDAIVEQLFTEIDNLRGDGLEPEDYRLSALRARFARLPATDVMTAAAVKVRADFDVAASRAYLLSLAHLFRGKVNPAALDPQWNFTRNDIALKEAMKIVNDGIAQHDLAAVYERARPQHFLYQRARAALKRLRAIANAGGWPQIDTQRLLKPGMSDPHIAVLRSRLLDNGTTHHTETGDADFYDSELVAAVRNYQREQYLDADGIVGPATRAALNVSVQTRIDQLRVNLERGRWLLHDLNGDFVVVDIAGYKIYFFRDGQRVWQSQVQVGQRYRKTPVFKAKITYITFNPTWTVPPTILRKDILPKLKRNLGYLAKNNIRVLDNNDRQLDPQTIDWNSPPGNITLRQDAGDDAALGQVAIRFPNPYSVYLHDTPHRELFGNTIRAFSSGCIRVERPLELVELLFNDPQKWNRAAIEQFIATDATRNVYLPKPVPILLEYWTVDLFEDGTMGFKPDIYDRDAAVLKALNARL